MKTSKLAQKFILAFPILLITFLIVSSHTLPLGLADPLITETYAQETEEESEEEIVEEEVSLENELKNSIVKLDHVLVNNEKVKILGGDKVMVSFDDAVRISGNAKPNTSLSIFFADKEITTTVNENGYWVVLFSITAMEENQYVVTVKPEDSEESTPLITLVVGDGQEVIEPLLDRRPLQIITFLESLPSYLLLLILLPLTTVLGWVLGSRFERKRKSDKKRKK